MENWGVYISEAEGEGAGITWGQLKLAIETAQEMTEKKITAERKQ